jgi:hypothetical protein
VLVDVARAKSDTVDEDTYLGAAALLWAHGDQRTNAESPILPKWAFAAAMVQADRAVEAAPRALDAAQRHVLWYGPRERTERVLFAARLTTVAVTVGAGLLVGAIGRRFGAVPAVVSQALWTFSPTVLAAGSLATLDAWVTAAVVVVTWAVVRHVERPHGAWALAVGLACGLALACKLTALGAAGFAVLAVAWSAHRQGRRAAAVGHVVAVMAGAALALWAVYQFRVGPVAYDTASGARVVLSGWAPFPAWIEGALSQVLHGTRGHRSYLFGRTGREGWWWFYVACLAVKTTVGAQLLAVLLLAASWRRRADRGTAPDAALLAFPAALFGAMSLGRAQLGVKYILPAFPGAMLWAGRAFPRLPLAWPRWGAAAGVVLLALGAAESLRVHPDYLMFANAWVGGPANGPRYFVVGDGIGQDQKALGEWQVANHIEWIYYTRYSGSPEQWGVAYAEPPCEPRRGVYALEAVEVHRPRRVARGCLDWLTAEPPDLRLGHSIYVYVVDRARAERLETPPAGPVFWKSGPPDPSPSATP